MIRAELLGELKRREKTLGTFTRRFLAHPLRYVQSNVFRRLVFPLTRQPWLIHTNLLSGHTIQVPLPAANDLFLFGLKADESERRLTRWLIQNIQVGDCFVDVGAHLGFYSLLGAKLGAKVLAIEASPRTYAWLKANLEMNQETNVEALNLAMADTKGELTFTQYPVYYSEYNSLNQKALRQIPKGAEALTIASETLDGLLSERTLVPTCIKIDVEGAEELVIRGAVGTLMQHKPWVVLEIADGVQQRQEPHRMASELLTGCGYEAYRILANGELELWPTFLTDIANAAKGSENVVFAAK
jgi:FkbM family methyltransferase